jgi:hypothetical protein
MSEKDAENKTLMALILVLMLGAVSCMAPQQTDRKEPQTLPSENTGGAHAVIWIELLQKTPFPHTAPLPPRHATVLDGFYTKFDPEKTPPVACRRCPDYVPEGGIWKLNLDKGVFRIFHEFTGWRSIGSFVVDGNRVHLFNDPTCMEPTGIYTWELKAGHLRFKVIDDECAIGMRAKNLTQLPWTSCQPPSMEAGTSGHWNTPPGCD